MPTEYNYIEDIGSTYESGRTLTEKRIGLFHHQEQVKTVLEIIRYMNLRPTRLIDLGCSTGGWFKDFKKVEGLTAIIGIDISKDRLLEAKQRGYTETHCTNAYTLPFDDESEDLIVCNGMFVHVLQDSDRLKILQEIQRVLKKDGVFIFDFTKYNKKSTTYCHTNSLKEIISLVNKTNLRIEQIKAGYYLYPEKGCHPRLSYFSTKFVFPFTNKILKKLNNKTHAKTIYLGIRKSNGNFK